MKRAEARAKVVTLLRWARLLTERPTLRDAFVLDGPILLDFDPVDVARALGHTGIAGQISGPVLRIIGRGESLPMCLVEFLRPRSGENFRSFQWSSRPYSIDVTTEVAEFVSANNFADLYERAAIDPLLGPIEAVAADLRGCQSMSCRSFGTS